MDLLVFRGLKKRKKNKKRGNAGTRAASSPTGPAGATSTAAGQAPRRASSSLRRVPPYVVLQHVHLHVLMSSLYYLIYKNSIK